MGALHFAMDTLASLSSVLAPARGNGERLDLSSFEIKLDDSGQRAFQEFITGMKMLHKHGMRNGCDISTIARQNIKLLHTNLKSSLNYRNTISLIRSNANALTHRNWLPMLENNDLLAGFLYLSPHGSISLNQCHTNYSQCGQNSSVNHASEGKFTQLFVNVLGKTRLNLHHRYSFANNSPTLLTLKNGEAFAEDPGHVVVERLSTDKEASLLLNIQWLDQL